MLLRYFLIAVLLIGAQATVAQSLTERLGKAFGSSPAADEILDPDEAFRYEANAGQPLSIQLQWQIVDGYYLYKDKFAFRLLDDSSSIDQEKLVLPPGKMKQDPLFGNVEIHTGSPLFDLPLKRATGEATSLDLELKYQGCKEDSVCYPPITRLLTIELPELIPSAAAATSQETPTSPPRSEQDIITANLEQGSLLLNLLAFFGFGILLSLTPCVFPMIPILSGIIVGQGENITTRRALALSLAYVLAMALCYALLGVIAGLFFINLQAAFQTPWLIVLFSSIFVLLALSMFGFYELQLPASIQSRLSNLGDRQKGGSLIGAALMGGISAIIVGPCVAPPLAGALLYISQTGNAVQGGLNLFSMGLGFGVPLLIIGASSGSLLPRAGAWMENVKRTFGVIMLGVAIWFLDRILPGQATMLLWAALFIVSAVFLGALDSLPREKSWQGLWKGIGIIILVYGVTLVIGAASGSRSIFQPLEGLGGATQSRTAQELPFKRIKSITKLEQEVAAAEKAGRHVMLDFYADWCITCIEMEEYTFSDASVQAELRDFVLLQADVTANDEEDKALLKKFDIFGPPAILFFAPGKAELMAYRTVGFVEAGKFKNHLQQLKKSGQ